MLEQLFKLKEHKTNVRIELLAGLTTFMTMAYIIFVNPLILSDAGMDRGAVTTATILAAALSTILMGLWAKHPFALASGMGLNAFFAYYVAAKADSWEAALGAVFLSGVAFFVLAITGAITHIDAAVPTSLKRAVAVGIGLFIALIGMKNAGIVKAFEPTLVQLGDLSAPEPKLAIIGLLITCILMVFKVVKVRGAMLIGILLTTVIGIPMGVTYTGGGIVGAPASLSPILFKMDIGGALSLGFMVIFSFLFVDIFDTMGTLMGTATRTGMLDAKGRLPRVKEAMAADAVGTMFGAVVGTSTVTTYVESSAGIAEGGRTGLTAVVVGILFLLSLFFTPLATMVPGAATAPALIIVGVLMMGAVTGINFEDFTEALPAFMTIVVMPFTFSISHGIAAGFVFYPIVKLAAGRGKEVHPLVYALAVVSLAHLFPELLAFLG
ncbi:MAG: NCS2 family permease [Bacillota bacterium]